MFDDISTITVNGHEFYEEDLRKSCYIIAQQLFHANEKPLTAKLRGVQFLEAVHEIRPDPVPNIEVVRRLVGLEQE